MCSSFFNIDRPEDRNMEDLLQIGVITTTHGIRGEVKVYPTTGDVHRFEELNSLLLDTGREYRELEIQNVKYFKQYAILKFRGIDNINDIEKYKGKSLYVTRENAQHLDEDEYVDVKAYDLEELVQKILTGEIQDSKTVSAILAYKEKYVNR